MNVLLFLAVINLTINCKSQSQLHQISNYKTKIIGVRVSKDDPTYKIEFTSNGIQRQYVDNILQEETYKYSILASCGPNQSNGFDIYLKTESSLNDYNCDIINNIQKNNHGVFILSITTERGRLELYEKL